MKILLTERKYRIPLGNNGTRQRYLEKVIAQLNNELTDPALTPVDRSRFYSAILAALKTVHEISCDAKLEQLELRIIELEKQRKEEIKR